jgi:hypothetical protein
MQQLKQKVIYEIEQVKAQPDYLGDESHQRLLNQK